MKNDSDTSSKLRWWVCLQIYAIRWGRAHIYLLLCRQIASPNIEIIDFSDTSTV